MVHSRLFRGLGLKLLLLTILIQGAAGYLAGYWMVKQERQVFFRMLSHQGAALADSVALSTVEPMLMKDYPLVEDFFAVLIAEVPDVAFATLVRDDGVTVAEHNKDQLATGPLGMGLHPDDGIQVFRQQVILPDSDGHVLGTVVVGISTEVIEKQILARQDEIRRTVLYSLLVTLALLGFALRYSVLVPLRYLAKKARTLGKGDYDAEIELSRRDEMGELAEDLDQMRKDLGSSYTELQVQHNILEQTSEELQEALERAQDADKAKSAFLATMSHEIRTPMNGILGMNELLLDTELDGEQQEYARIVQTSGRALLDIINDVLDFSKIEASMIEIESIPVDLHRLIEDVIDMFAEQARSKDLQLWCSLTDNVPKGISSDPMRLRQILVNLIGNALKYTESGGVEVVVLSQTTATDGSRSELSVEVRDTGIGIDESMRDNIFKPFQQADNSMSRRFGGTGLGLAISSQIARLMGGGIRVEANPGGGSVFVFDFPADILPGQEGYQRRSASGQIALMCSTPLMQAGLRRQLETHGYTVCDLAAETDPAALLQKQQDGKSPWVGVVLEDRCWLSWQQHPLADRLRKASVPVAIVGDQAQQLAKQKWPWLVQAWSMPISPRRFATHQPLLDGRPVAAAVEQKRQSEAAKQAQVAAYPPQSWKGMRVLLVEDNKVNRLFASKLLSTTDLDVVLAHDGQEAIQRWLEGGIDLVLMDCQMPVMDGWQATAKIRELEKELGTHTPIIALTANALKGDRSKCLAAGMDDYLAKPIDRASVIQMLKRWLGPSSSAA